MLALAFTLFAAPVPREATAAEKYEAAVIGAIHLFVRENEEDYLDALLEKHPKLVNELQRIPKPTKPSHTDVFTPLHWAARGGCTRSLVILLKHRADMNADSGDGWTALHLAAREGHLDVVKELVEHGANTAAKTKPLPEREFYAPSAPPGADIKPIKFPAEPARTALDIAIEFKKTKVVEYLKSIKDR